MKLSVIIARFDRRFVRKALMTATALFSVAITQNACNEATTEAKAGEVVTTLVADSAYRGFVGDTGLVIAGIYNGKNVDPDSPRGEKILNAVFKWTSSNPAVIALINDDMATTQDAHFLSKSIGTATLTVTLDDPRISLAPGVSGSATVIARVGERPVSIRLLPHNPTIRVGETAAMHWEVQTASGQPTFTDRILAGFSCLDQTIAADHNASEEPTRCGNPLANSLNLRALNPGTEKVIVYVTNLALRDTVLVTVLPAITPTRVEVSPTSARLLTGNSRQLNAVVYDQSNAVINAAQVIWLSGNVAAASVSAQGLVKGESTLAADSQNVQITARAATGVEAVTNVTVYRAVSSVIVSPNPKTLQVGSTHPFTYQLKATNNTDIPLDLTTVTWSTGNNSYATVNQAGVVTAVAPGTTTVTAKTAEGVAGSANITVEAPPPPPPAQTVVRVVVSPASITLPLSALRCQFTAKGFDASGNEVTGLTFRWLVDDSNLANVDSNGLVTFNTRNNEGTTHVRAFYGTASDAPNGSATLTLQ